MQRPDRERGKRVETNAYIDYLEERVERLEADLRAATKPGKPYAGIATPASDHAGPYVEGSATSKAAAKLAATTSGEDRARVLEALVRAGDYGCTRNELAEVVRNKKGKLIPENTIRPRVCELVEGGWAREDEERTRLTPARRNAAVLVATDAGRRAHARLSEGLPPVPPTKRDGSPALPPPDLRVPRNLFDSTVEA